MHTLLEMPTGYGKTKRALDLCKERQYYSLLIVVPRVVLINSWREEIKKWGYKFDVEYITYVSLWKANKEYDCVIFDECHHLSERCQKFVKSKVLCKQMPNSILLSASINRELKCNLKEILGSYEIEKVSTRQAIEEERLPEPTVYLMPLELEDKERTEIRVMFPKLGVIHRVEYPDRNTAPRGCRIEIECTPKEYYSMLEEEIERYKSQFFTTKAENIKRQWLLKCNERLKWLSWQKTEIVNKILNAVEDYKTITFCSSIKQSKLFRNHCVNSQVKNSMATLALFNQGRINHITAVDMLNEGVNLVDCQMGIYAGLHSSDRLIIQQLGRLLRHKNPIIIIPYFVGTRDEEIVGKMMEHYNKDKVKIIKDIKEIEHENSD